MPRFVIRSDPTCSSLAGRRPILGGRASFDAMAEFFPHATEQHSDGAGRQRHLARYDVRPHAGSVAELDDSLGASLQFSEAMLERLANRIELFGKQLVAASDLLDDVVAEQMFVGRSLAAEVKHLVCCDADGPGAKRPGRVVLLKLSYQGYGHPLKHFVGL